MLAGDTTFIISLQHGLWSSLIIILIDINKIFFFKFKMHCIDMDCAFMHGQLFWQMYGKGRLFFFFCKSVYQQCLKHCSFAWKKLCTFPSDVENTPVWRCESTKLAKFSAIFLKLLPVQFCLIMIAKRCKSRTQMSAYDQFQVLQDNGNLWGTTVIIWRSTYKYPKDELWERPFNISGFM